MVEHCPPPDVDCLWRVSGYSRAFGSFRKHLGLVRAPDRETALRLAVLKFSRYRDITISPSPLANL